MVSQELLEAYERLLKRKKLHEEAIKFGNIISKVGGAILIISFIYIFVSSTFKLPDPGSVLAIGLVLGLLVLFIGQKIVDRKTLLAPFSIAEQEFLNFVDSLKDIETFQKEGIEFSRIEAAERLSEFEMQLTEPKFDDKLWENLTKEANENMRLLKQNFKERLIPSITQGKGEDINKSYSIIENFAKYLLNPTVSEIKDLNTSMSKLSFYPSENSRLIPFLGHPYMRHAYIFIIFGAFGFFAFRLGIGIGVSTDTAYTVGFGIFGALAAGYMIFMVKKD